VDAKGERAGAQRGVNGDDERARAQRERAQGLW